MLIGKAKAIILAAELKLGVLSTGQKVDLLLDNMPELKDSQEARVLVEAFIDNRRI